MNHPLFRPTGYGGLEPAKPVPLPADLPATAASPTSQAAAAGVERRLYVVRGRCRSILRDVADHGPSTREEICERLDLPEKCACGPINRMHAPKDVRHAKLLCVAGRRPTHSGAKADVYSITEEGRAALQQAEDASKFVTTERA